MSTPANILPRVRHTAWHVKTSLRRTLENACVFVENRVRTSERTSRLLLFDDYFPQLGSAFRVVELNAYLERFENAEVHSTAVPFAPTRVIGRFSEVMQDYDRTFPQFRGRIFKFHPKRRLHGELAYCLFLCNAARLLPVFEEQNLPFVFTLYPGGGFRLNGEVSDARLQRVFASPCFQKVIVTQQATHEYLLNRRLCPEDKIEFMFGGLVPINRLMALQQPKKYYRRDKETFDVCFVGNKYMPRGEDKGYDVFIEVAKALARKRADVFFHVVGGFVESDIDVRELRERIRFYGVRDTDFFPAFYSNMDIILSPNAPFLLAPGAFDGFPTACCSEAGICGVAVFCTDELKQNPGFKHGQEFILIDRNVERICSRIESFHDHCNELYSLAHKGQQAFRKAFDFESQIGLRIRVLSECMKQATLAAAESRARFTPAPATPSSA